MATGSTNSYIFILCPPYSGSTLLWKLVATSNAVSSLPMEGQYLPELREIMRKDPWNANAPLPWKRIKEVWEQYWDLSKPLLVEKSPPHIIRSNDIIEHFSPTHFLLMVRNPYAHCEGLMRRNKWSAQRAAQFTVRCLRQQADNAEKLNGALSFSYEDLVGDPLATAQRITSHIPGLGKLDHTKSFDLNSIDGRKSREIVDLNGKKIDNLSLGSLKTINHVLEENIDLMGYWGYELYKPSRLHALTFSRTRAALLFSKARARTRAVITKLTKRLAKRRAWTRT